MHWKALLLLVTLLTIADNRPIRHSKHKKTKTEASLNDDSFGDPSKGVFVYLSVSEVNTDTTAVPPKRFIELQTLNSDRELGAKDKMLLGWRLLMIKGTTMEVVMSIDLSHHLPKHRSNFIVIGDANVPNVDISLFNEKTEVAFDVDSFPDLDASPYCLAVVSTLDEYSATLLSLPTEDGRFKPLPLKDEDERQQLIFLNAWNVVVIARGATTNQCSFCSSLFPSRSFPEGLKYLLRDREDRSSSTNDYSLNYCCPELVPYSPSCFKLGHPSPGLKNDCTGRRFILEFQASSISTSNRPAVFIDQNEGNCPADFPGIEPYQYPAIHDHDYAQAVARVMKRSGCSTVENMDVKVKKAKTSPVVTSVQSTTPEPPKKYLTDFDRNSFMECQHIFSRPNELLWAMYSLWLDVKKYGEQCRIKCRICVAYFEAGWRPDQKHKKYIQDRGFYSSRKTLNQDAVTDHLDHPVHVEAAYFYGLLDAATTRDEQLEIEATQHQREKKRLKPTMNEVALGFAEIKARTSFKSHRVFMDAVSELGVDVGFKHRHEESLSQLSCVLSSCMHKRLLTRLVKDQPFFSLICDGTTNRQVPYLTCLMQTLENANPIVYFWGLLVITTGETGYNMVEDVKIRVSDDDKIVPGFEEYFKSKLVASVSDSASNMAGSRNSFYTYLKDYVERPIALVKCGAHKLQRAILHGLDFPTDEPSPDIEEKDRSRYFKDFTKINNGFYSFYMSRGSKRFQEFVELAEELDLHAYRIHYFFDVRWAASHKKCMETLYRNYDALRADLSRINTDRDFDDTAKSKALELYNHLLDKTFIVVVAEFVDLLTVFEKMSENFQKKGGVMIANTEIIRQGYKKLLEQKEEIQKDSKLAKFLAKCSCADVCQEGQCTLEQYDQCPEVLYKDTESLTDRTDGRHTIHLSQFRSQLYNNMLSQLVSYFEPILLESFEVLNPKNFKTTLDSPQETPRDCQDLSICYEVLPTIVPGTSPKTPEENFRGICTFYGVTECKSILQEWKILLASILSKSCVVVLNEDDPAKFWPLMFQNTEITIPAGLKDLLEKVLVTSFTSADAERAFSMVTHIKTQDRTNMGPKTLENLLRVTFNGPDKLSEDSLYEYAREFAKKTSRVDDPSAMGGGSPSPEAFKSFFKKSEIF